jgi:hypothetical protein
MGWYATFYNENGEYVLNEKSAGWEDLFEEISEDYSNIKKDYDRKINKLDSDLGNEKINIDNYYKEESKLEKIKDSACYEIEKRIPGFYYVYFEEQGCYNIYLGYGKYIYIDAKYFYHELLEQDEHEYLQKIIKIYKRSMLRKMERFLLKYVILHPNSKYIRRLVSEF